MASKATKGSSISTSDMNQTDPIKAQGPLAPTLGSYERWDMNEMLDPAKDGDKMIRGRGSKP